MKKIEIIGLLQDSKRIIERLQRRGIVELCDTEGEELVRTNTAASVAQFSRSRSACENALEILDRYAPEKTGILGSLGNDRQRVEIHAFGKKAGTLESAMQAVYGILSLEKQINDGKAEINRLQVLHDSLVPWMELDIPLNFSGTEKTACLIGTVPGEMTSAVLAPLMGEGAEIQIISSCPEQTCICVLCLKTARQTVYEQLRTIGFALLGDTSSMTAIQQMTAYETGIAAQRKKIAADEEKIRKGAEKRADFRFFADYLALRADKYAVLNRLAMTERTFVVTGYIPEKYAGQLMNELERHYKVAVRLYEADEDEDVPVKLENSWFSEPVEGITEMYALPDKRDVDPTPVMSFFYYFFFGLMLSDAGYGVLMVILTWVALKKFHFDEKMRKMLKMFQYCGISTIVWGALFGSWFGDAIPVIAENFFGAEIQVPCWFEPINDPIRLLLYSFAFGVVHLFFGLGVNFSMLWKEGRRWDAVFDTIPVYLTVLGVLPIGASIMTTVPGILTKLGGYTALIGAILVVLTSGRSAKNIFMKFFGGLYGLYNVATGYLGDILSYSRLLALGLATGSIAGVINMIGAMPENMILKTVLFIVVFLGGHTLNILINLLGAYVHTSRLQFVEMFSKFYEGGGRPFEPLTSKTKYITFTEESNHE